MIVVDYLMVNEDRHQNNFGLIRNVKTLEFIGVAPIFDTGSALWFDQPTHMMGGVRKLECKPFKKNHEEQLKLVDSFDWLNLDQLVGIEDEIRRLFEDALYIDEQRRERIIEILQIRIDKLSNHIRSHQGNIDELEDDVKQNMAYSGK